MTIIDDKGRPMSEEDWNKFPAPEPPELHYSTWREILTAAVATTWKRGQALGAKGWMAAEQGAERWFRWVADVPTMALAPGLARRIYVAAALVFVWGFVLGALIF